MSASAALIQSIIATPTPLRTINRIRIRLTKTSPSNQASLRHFLARRLPVLRYHNPSLAVEISRLPGAEGCGLEVTKGKDSFLFDHPKLRDDELFTMIVAMDRAKNFDASAPIPGVQPGQLQEVKDIKKVTKATTASSTNAAAAKPATA